MIALLDINVLIALFDAAHVHHEAAHAWMQANSGRGWASCPITENGCIRVMSQANYPGHLSVTEITRRLIAATDTPEHSFWPDSISFCDSKRFQLDHILSSKPLTDLYLLALALENKGRLVTFDRTISLPAVAGAKTKHLAVL